MERPSSNRRLLAGLAALSLVTVAAAPPQKGDGDDRGDQRVHGTSYNATADVPCTLRGRQLPPCPAGVTRGPDQIAVDVKLPGNKVRTLLFDGKGKFVTAATAEADGSAAYRIASRRKADWTTVTVGPETYRVPDVFLLGD